MAGASPDPHELAPVSYQVFLPPPASVIKRDIAAGLHKLPRKERAATWRRASKARKAAHQIPVHKLQAQADRLSLRPRTPSLRHEAAEGPGDGVGSLSHDADSTASASLQVKVSYPGQRALITPTTADPFAITPSTGNPRGGLQLIRTPASPSLPAGVHLGHSLFSLSDRRQQTDSLNQESGYSIVPDHSLHFDEHRLVTLRELLEDSSRYLANPFADLNKVNAANPAEAVGGLRFAVLALVKEVGPIVRWKGRTQNATCEVSLMDTDLSTLTLLLKSEYAERWAGDDAFDYDSSAVEGPEQENALAFLETVDYGRVQRWKKDEQAVPLRAGDVVAISGLSLVQRTLKDASGKMLCALADPQKNAKLTVELCYRCDAQTKRDEQHRFDHQVAQISSKHEQVLRLARMWHQLHLESQSDFTSSM